MTETEIADALARLMPAGVCCGVARVADYPLMPEELGAVSAAGDKRRRDFSSGREAARRALAALGRPPLAIPSGPRRAPQWPAGIRGSISHAGEFAIGVATCEPLAIGVDLEVVGPLTPDVEQLVTTPFDRLGTSPALLAFSAKESVYKAVYPEEGWQLEFRDVALEVRGPNAFVATARWEEAMRELEGRFAFVGEYLVTLAFRQLGNRVIAA